MRRRRRGFFGSFLEFGTLAGFSLGALLMLGFSLLLSDARCTSWGWRMPFLVAAPLGLVGMYLRSRIEDTPVFRELEAKGQKEEAATTAFRPDHGLLAADPAPSAAWWSR